MSRSQFHERNANRARVSHLHPVACYAPPLTEALLARYKQLAESCTDQRVRDGMLTCLACVESWWALPESTRKDGIDWQVIHAGQRKRVTETPLEDAHVEALWDVTPWMDELTLLSNSQDTGVFDRIDPKGQAELRNAAFHLLWHCKELTLDREPMTQDRLN